MPPIARFAKVMFNFSESKSPQHGGNSPPLYFLHSLYGGKVKSRLCPSVKLSPNKCKVLIFCNNYSLFFICCIISSAINLYPNKFG